MYCMQVSHLKNNIDFGKTCNQVMKFNLQHFQLQHIAKITWPIMAIVFFSRVQLSPFRLQHVNLQCNLPHLAASRTAVLLMPSLWQESFGLVAVEARSGRWLTDGCEQWTVAMLLEHFFVFSSFYQLAHLRYSRFELFYRVSWKWQRRLKLPHHLFSVHMVNPTSISIIIAYHCGE